MSAVGIAALTAGASTAASPRTYEELIGRRLIVAVEGARPSASLIERARRGEIAGVIVFGANASSPSQLRALTASLQAAARSGRQPPLLVLADQEGGVVRRLRWAPPVLSARDLGVLDPPEIRAIAGATGRALRRVGVNVDLAPVADVPAVRGSFLAAQERAFSSTPRRAASAVAAFATGLEEAGVASTLKHFPGLGRATTTTDEARVTISATQRQLERGLAPFAAVIHARAARLVMLSSAAYPAWDVRGSAAWSPTVLGRLRALGFAGVTVTDALEPLARTHGRSLGATALLSARAGVDLLLLTGREATTAAVHRSLVAAARAGRLRRSELEASAARVDALAASLPR